MFEFFSLGLVIRFANWVDDTQGISLVAMILVIVGFFGRVLLFGAFAFPFTAVPQKMIIKLIAYGIIAVLIACESSLHFTAAVFMSSRASAQTKEGLRIFGWVTAGCIYATVVSELVFFLLLLIYLVYYLQKHKETGATAVETLETKGYKPAEVIPLGETKVSN